MIRFIVLWSIVASNLWAKIIPGKCPQVPGTLFTNSEFNDKAVLLLGATFSPEKTSFLFIEKNPHKNRNLNIQMTEPLTFILEYLPRSTTIPSSLSLVIGNTSETLLVHSMLSLGVSGPDCWNQTIKEEIRW